MAADEAGRIWLAKQLQTCLQELEGRILALIRSDYGDASGSEDAQFGLGQRDVVVACLRCWLIAIERGGRWSGPVPPEVDVQARSAVHNGVTLSTALARYTAAQELAWGLVIQEVQAIEDANTRRELLVGAWASTASLFACLVRAVTEAHTAESDARRKTRKRRDDERVLGLLVGQPDVDLQGIDYDFDGYHLGLIASGPEARDALRALAKELRCSLWPIERENGSVWAWLGSRSSISTTDVEHCFLDGPHRDVKLVGGRVERTIRGFSLTHKQAETALRVARRRTQRVTWYADVEDVALVMQDEQLAKSMIAAWITPILQQHNGRALLNTLQTFFACAHSKSQTADALPADRHTVKSHLDHVEEVIGQPLQKCAAKLELALRVYELCEDDGTQAR